MSIEWNDSYRLGGDKRDAHHQHLFDLARKLLAADDVATVKGLALELYKHTRIHFEDEEGRMRQHRYPGLEAHSESHNRLLGRLDTLTQEIGKGKLYKPELDALMTDWAMFHIPLDDARFAAYLKSTA